MTKILRLKKILVGLYRNQLLHGLVGFWGADPGNLNGRPREGLTFLLEK